MKTRKNPIKLQKILTSFQSGQKTSAHRYDILEPPGHWSSARYDYTSYFSLNPEQDRPKSARYTPQSPRSPLVVPDQKKYNNLKNYNFLDNIIEKLKDFSHERKSLKTQQLKQKDSEKKTLGEGLLIRSYDASPYYQQKETSFQKFQPNSAASLTLATPKSVKLKKELKSKKNIFFPTEQPEKQKLKKKPLAKTLPKIKPKHPEGKIYCQGKSPLLINSISLNSF